MAAAEQLSSSPSPSPVLSGSPLHVALVTETFPPEVNGVARTLWQLVSGLARRGHDVEVLRPDQKAAEGERPAAGWRDVLMAGVPIPVYEGLRFGLPAPRKLLARWRARRPDIVHVATEGPLGLSALWAARRLGIGVASTFHTNFHEYGRFYGYGALRRIAVAYLRWFHARTACTLVPADDVAARLRDQGFERVDVLSRGVDGALFHPGRRDETLRAAWGAARDDLVVAFVSRLAEEKNPELAAESFAAVREVVAAAGRRCRCVVVGDGPAMAHMRRLEPDAIFAGMRRGPDLAAHYASADLMLFPSTSETFGNVQLEGMASGLATVSFDYAAAGMLVTEGVDGFKVPRSGPESERTAYLETVRRVATLPVAEIRAAGRRAAECAASATWERVVETFETQLRAAASGSVG